jgi:hypothetical protein
LAAIWFCGVALLAENPFLDGYTSLSEFARLINHSERAVQRWVQIGQGPPITRIGTKPSRPP